MANLVKHQHGKSRVRLGRTWREGDKHYFVEWEVQLLLKSDMEHAFLSDSNADMTATDTCKNSCYYIAKQMTKRASPEEYAIALAEFMCKTHPKVHACEVTVSQKPWTRVVTPSGAAHDHGYSLTAPATRTALALAFDNGSPTKIYGGLKEMSVLKTTQSGYSGFKRDSLTMLPDTAERMLATSLTSTWSFPAGCSDYDAAYDAIVRAFSEGFYGPPKGGVFSPSVQRTLFQMASLAIKAVPSIESVTMDAPNIHFLPTPPAGIKFQDDVYIATSEPHGTIQCTVSRKDVHAPVARL